MRRDEGGRRRGREREGGRGGGGQAKKNMTITIKRNGGMLCIFKLLDYISTTEQTKGGSQSYFEICHNIISSI